jgi:leader peptidase (prepilin peptidase)/N-methyltransferase
MKWLLWFVWGSVLGSFLNVCIYRLPREQSVVRPRSRCPGCRKQIAWYDNLPLISFVRLGGRCRHCRKPISWRYPLVEALTGAATVAVLHRFGPNAVGCIYVAFVAALLAASFVDFEFQIIPDEISLGGLAAGLILSVLVPALHGTAIIGDFIFRKESMGGGDIKLLAMAGSILGWKAVLVTFFIAPVMALVPGLFVLLFKKSHIIPYGPFLSLALVVSLFWGDDLLRLSGMEDTVRLLRDYYESR